MTDANGDRSLPSRAISLTAQELQEMISRRAYEVYERRGAAPGDPLSDWLVAEQEVLAELSAATAEPAAPKVEPAAAAVEPGVVAAEKKPAPRRRASGTTKPRSSSSKRTRKPAE